MTKAQTYPTLLVVDDNESTISLLNLMLDHLAAQIFTALNGRDALEILKNQSVDLVLLDIMLPEMDGFQVCRQIRAHEPISEIPVIFLTAKTEKEDITTGFQAGGTDYITKPFNKEELIARINNHLEISSAKKRIAEQNEELRQLIALRDKVYSVISHDLRSFMSNLKMLSDAMNANIEKIQDEEIVEMMGMMGNNIDEASHFLDTLLEWTRWKSGRRTVNPVEFFPKKLVDDCISLFQSNTDQKNIEVIFSEPENLPEIYGDPDIFKIILRNLLSNAIKFSYENSSVYISHECRDNKLIISVKDFGAGIAYEDQKKLLREESHFTSKGTKDEKGTGLGLLMSYDLAQHNGGDLWFESTPGQGTTFFYSIPLKESVEPKEK